MMDSLGRYIAIMLVIVLILLYPLQYVAGSQTETMNHMIEHYSAQFTDTVRKEGNISIDIYEDYMEKLSYTGELFDIEIEHTRPKTAGDVISEFAKSGYLLASRENDYLPNLENGLLKPNLLTNKMLTTSSAHVHTEDCYDGHRHIDRQTYKYSHKHDYTCREFTSSQTLRFNCSRCGIQYDVVVRTSYWDKNLGRAVNGYVYPGGSDLNTCWGCHQGGGLTSENYNDYSYSCGYAIDVDGDGFTDQVGWDNTYVYDVSVPPGENRATYNSGCYTYHRTKIPTPMNEYGTPRYEDYVFTQILYYGINQYCEIPRYYEFRIRDNETGDIYFVEYEAVLNENGQVELRYKSASFSTFWQCNYPKTLTWYEAGYLRSSSSLRNFFFEHTNIPRYYISDDLTASQVYSDRLFICNHDHSQANRWVLTCGYDEAETNPICDQVVVSITATNPNQTITEGGNIVTTAIATYLDGHTGIVNCTATGFNKNQVGTQTVTLTYSGKVGNAKTTGTRTCTITVVVQANLQSLKVVASATTVYNGVEPTYTVTAHYGNGTSKTLTSSQYTKSGWSSGPGTKTVTFSYTESGKTVTASVTITVKPNVLRLDVTPSATTVYNGVEPTYTVKVVYENNTSITLTSSQYTRSGWSSGPGTKTVTFTYTENSKTVSKSVTITVKPNVSSITVTPSTQSVERYKNPSFTVRVNYENGTSAVTTSYTMTGFNNKNLGTQTVTFSYTENGITKTATAKVTVTNMTKVCPVCGTRYQLDNNDVDQGCPSCKSTIDYIVATPDNITLYQGENLPIMVTAVYRNGHRAVVTGWTSNYDPMKIGIQNITITYQGHKAYVSVHVQAKVKKCPVCNETYPLNPDGTDGGCPYCKETIVKIDVTPKTVTINLHQPLPIVVTAYYRDGHTAVVNDWSTSFIPDRAGEYSVTITYKTVSEVIKVIVKDSNITTCFYCGTEYNKLEHPQGCPVCAATIIGIEARLRDGGNKVYQGSKLNLEIILTFRDEHREIRYTGYTVSNYYPNKLGEQTVTVHYEGHSTNLTIVVIPLPAIKICPNGHEYYLNEDGTDPGCPFCFNLSGERNILYYEITYTGEILEALYSQGYYEMRAGDYITVIVTNRNTSLRARIKKLFRQTLDKETKMVFGGEVSGASD